MKDQSASLASTGYLESLMFSAKVDYVTLHTPGKITLPALDGVAMWSRKHNNRRLTIHDASAEDIENLIAVLGRTQLVELEVAVDLRPKNTVAADEREVLLRSVMVDIFARGLDPRAGLGISGEFRAFYRRLDAGYVVRPFNLGLPRATDQQLHGGRHDAAQVKGYWKRRDNGVELAPERQSARVEVRLGSLGLIEHNLLTIADVPDFPFRKRLAPYLRHVRGTSRAVRSTWAQSGNMAMLVAKQHEFDLEHWNQVGVGAFLRGGKRDGARVRFMRDTPVNNRIGQALTRLEQRFAKAKFVRADRTGSIGNPSLARLSTGSGKSRMTT